MSLDFANTILVFTDGACSGNPGRGGFGSIVVYPEGQVKELGEGRTATTNNRMEMLAVIRALEEINDHEAEIWILTDSTYVIRGITQWIWGWKKKNWRTAEGKEVTNQDLWKRLDQLLTKRKHLGAIHWKYVRGHTGVPGNERCDEIAVAFTKKQYIDLYSGPLLQYHIAIHDIPENTDLPPMRSKNEKKKAAHSYLSYVNGVLERHSTWPECEAKVKGRAGAKFKKSSSADNEKEIVSGWGLDPKKLSNLD